MSTGPRDSATLIAARGVRGFGDGFTALLLPVYLTSLGYSAFRVGVLTTATLLGSAALTLAVGLAGHRFPAKRLLFAACVLMAATGLAFSQAHAFWPLVIVGFVGTLNPSGGDVSPFLPLEQSLLAHAGPPSQRTRLFARYALSGSLMAALGALSVGLLDPLRATGLSRLTLIEWAFAVYGLLGLVSFLLYRRLPDEPAETETPRTALGPSRNRVLGLAALFSLDSFAGGFLVQSLFALWLFHRFGLSLTAAGAFFFWTGVLAALSQLAAPWLAKRVGLVNTMVFTHIPANLCVMAAAFAPNLPTAFSLLFLRALLSQMDVPARTSYVMAVVTPAERAAAAGVTNVPRSLASALSPALAGFIFSASPFAWPLVIGGGLKIAYDLLLLWRFQKVRPPEERDP
ncbi:MFS transporter [Phenylobacterium sp.]|jgi:MFS family permease|uniref:MFS transporter n=1 Tax=Phenylobacterium sp. TaxID=1871053 RepID=UPI002E370BC6|nr:MFS transporter [Phenylobacterium sp.]HEX3366094.1 MFS transporter [Phenylobacterium sp.]